jgi:pSer/pThr/pTyr-binding forkhead associated (FHA) protein
LLRLLVTKGRALGAEIKVEDELEIGRGAADTGGLAGDVEISRRHARIVRQENGSYFIEDLGSTNGTHVNGVQIDAPRPLSTGDTVEVGGTTLLVEEADTQAAAPAAPAPAEAAPATAEAGQTADRPAAAPVRIALQIEIDAEGRSATVRLNDGPETPIELEQRDGVWRLAADA